MHSIASDIIQTVLESKYADDAENLAVTSLITMQERVTALNVLSYTIFPEGKDITPKIRDTVNPLLSDIIFYAVILSHLNDVDMTIFDVDVLTKYAENFHPDYLTDAILCGNQLLGSTVELFECMFDSSIEPEDLEETEPENDIVPEGANPEEVATIPSTDIFEIDEEKGATEVQLLASIFASVILLAEKYDTDLGIVMYNASVQKEI